MANALYSKFKEDLLSGAINLPTDTIKIVLVDSSGYVYSAAHTSLADVLVADRVKVSGALASKTVVGGKFDAADITISAVTGNAIASIVIYKDTGVEATSRLIAFIDRDSAAAVISLTPNGSDVLVTWDALGIFDL